MFCSKCGTQLTEGTAFCSTCGQPVSGPSPRADVAIAYALPVISPYAGFWLRVIAAIIDAILLGIPLLIVIGLLAVIMGISGGVQNLRPDEGPGALFAVLGVTFILAVLGIVVVGGWLYFALMESSGWQGTLGKKALGLYVTDLQGSRVTFGRASGRYFGGRFLGHVPLFGALYFFIDCIMAGLTSSKQALHDMIAGCLVLRKN